MEQQGGMIIEPLNPRIRELIQGFRDDDERGVFAFSGRLDVRPPFQREFIYDEDKQRKVIDTIIKERPLNVQYYGVSDIDGRYVLIDGQQRTMSICRFVTGKFSIKYNGVDTLFSGLPSDIQDNILNYEMLVYKCTGSDSAMLEWFETINIASVPLTQQELRNAVYTGTWLSDAKRYFSKTNCPAVQVGGDYIKGSPNRQEILEEVLKWISDAEGIKITDYMGQHRHDANASGLWDYFNNVIKWVKATFGGGFKDMKGVKWGILYNRYHENHYIDDKNNILCTINNNKGLHSREAFLHEIERLQEDEDVTSRQGIYDYILSGDERKLSIRKFPDKIKMKKYRTQQGKCAVCGGSFDYDDLVADHIQPWSQGGRTIEGNCQLLCFNCNSKKSDKIVFAKGEISCCSCGKPVVAGRYCQYCGAKN